MKLPIYTPKPVANRDRRRLTQLLARLLDEKLGSHNSNLPEGEVVLSASENDELTELVSKISEDKSFFIELAFVEGLLGSREISEGQLKEIYLSERKKRGYSRALSSGQWHQFKTRLGDQSGSLSTYLRAARPMPFEHFLRMEQYLFSFLGIHPNAIEFLISKVEQFFETIEAARDSIFDQSKSMSLDISVATRLLIDELQERRHSMSTQQIAGLTTVVANSSVLFTTRDWSVSGTMSTMAGGLILAKKA